MEEDKKKKKKLTLSVSSKKKIEPISYAKGVKTSVVVEKRFHRKKSNISSNFSKGSHQFKQNINTKKSTPNKDGIFSSIGAAEILTPFSESFSIKFGSLGE